jgi:lipopolysaccharide/colanic/teichoic acid biosynthesis glycosyltransferase
VAKLTAFPQHLQAPLKMLDQASDAPPVASNSSALIATAERRWASSTGIDRRLQGRLKRAADVALALALVLLTLPLGAFVGLVIKLHSSGPMFSRQPRLGRNGRRYSIVRFRTPENTVGEFLRYTRLEDLPQLANVLRGEMTLIGTGAERSIFAD